ncbi:hypothetical protein C5167_007063 [Papaver somniferum]|uniref:Uncharacterized protein n=1 Tax=Papaver somniferum TaxID=3469 RepID=A0A4Y7JJ05_PAPSO|nr:hypothetical protein C5167_007063 [Papaver somniferum]
MEYKSCKMSSSTASTSLDKSRMQHKIGSKCFARTNTSDCEMHQIELQSSDYIRSQYSRNSLPEIL